MLSRFAFSVPPAPSQAAVVTYPEDEDQVEHDEDGDLLLNRRSRHCLLVLGTYCLSWYIALSVISFYLLMATLVGQYSY